MAKKKSAAAANRHAAAVKTAAKLTGLTQAEVNAIDKKCEKDGKRPLSFMAVMLDKTIKHVPKLQAHVAKLATKK